MKFWKKRPFKVKLRGRSGIAYVEGDRQILVGSEFMADENPGIIIYTNSLKGWEPPHENDPLTEEDIERIKSNILVDLERHKIIAEWI